MYIGMFAQARPPPNALHSSSNNECEQTGFGRLTALFSSARSRLTSRISPWCATLVWSTHGLVSAFFHVGRQFVTSRPNHISMRAPETTVVVPNGSHYRDSHCWLVLVSGGDYYRVVPACVKAVEVDAKALKRVWTKSDSDLPSVD